MLKNQFTVVPYIVPLIQGYIWLNSVLNVVLLYCPYLGQLGCKSRHQLAFAILDEKPAFTNFPERFSGEPCCCQLSQTHRKKDKVGGSMASQLDNILYLSFTPFSRPGSEACRALSAKVLLLHRAAACIVLMLRAKCKWSNTYKQHGHTDLQYQASGKRRIERTSGAPQSSLDHFTGDSYNGVIPLKCLGELPGSLDSARIARQSWWYLILSITLLTLVEAVDHIFLSSI